MSVVHEGLLYALLRSCFSAYVFKKLSSALPAFIWLSGGKSGLRISREKRQKVTEYTHSVTVVVGSIELQICSLRISPEAREFSGHSVVSWQDLCCLCDCVMGS
jgi:hypothetical protein